MLARLHMGIQLLEGGAAHIGILFLSIISCSPTLLSSVVYAFVPLVYIFSVYSSITSIIQIMQVA